MSCTTESTGEHDLSLTRFIPCPPETLFRCWSEPELLKQWFCPLPWTVSHAELDVRPGGSSLVVMRSPEGEESPHRGVYLDVEKNRKIVFTDAFESAWAPSGKAFMVATIRFDPAPGGTAYSARVGHWTAEDKTAHETMGFHQGWGAATDQLAALAATL